MWARFSLRAVGWSNVLPRNPPARIAAQRPYPSVRSRWIKFFGNLAGWLKSRSHKQLNVNEVRDAKNIFEKMAKIPPGELQECGVVVKGWDETRVSTCAARNVPNAERGVRSAK
jgi:hypothetical protein